MTSERIKEIQEQTPYPNSVSVMLALKQVWNECEQEKIKNYSIPVVIWRCNHPVTDTFGNHVFTKNRVYEEVDGLIIDNNGDRAELSLYEDNFTLI